MQKHRMHPVRSDRYISLMITTNTAQAGRFVRIPKLMFLLFAVLLVGIGFLIGNIYVYTNTLEQDIVAVRSEKQLIEEAKADTEALLSEREAYIAELLASIEEKESKLSILETQAKDILSKIESLEAVRDSIYEKLNEAPAELYISEAADIVPYQVSRTLSSYDDAVSSEAAVSFDEQYSKLLSMFSAIEDSLNSNHNELNTISDMIDVYLPYVDAIPSGYPIKDTHITCEFGYRSDPVTNESNVFHAGIDFSAKYKQDIYATASGTVILAGFTTGYGYNVVIDHGYGFVTRYAHCSKLLVKKGDTVSKGDCIARAGSSGKSTAVHLHYEVKVDGENVDPADYLN